MPAHRIALGVFFFGLAAIAAALASAAPIDQPERIGVDNLPPEEAEDGAIAPALPEGLQEINDAKQALAKGDLDQCHNKLRAAYAKSPNLPPPKLMLARLLLNARQVAHGRQLLEEEALAHPNHPDVYLLLGKLALADGHATDAALQFEKALSLPPPGNWNDGQRQYLQQACLEGQTMVAELRGNWREAAKLYQRQVEANPKNANLRDRSAMALFRSGELEQAFEQFDIAHLQDDTMNPPEVSMAVMYVQQGDYDKADEWFEKALASHGDDPQVHFERSIALLYVDRTDEADTHATKAAQLGLDSPLFLLHRGMIGMQKGDWPRAEEFFRAALKSSPENTAAMAKLALALVEQSDAAKQAEAIKLAEQAAKQGSNTVEVAATLGWVYYRGGEKEKAAPLLEAAGTHPAADPTALFFYARWLVDQKETEKARQAAQLLAQRIEQPGLFALRPGVRKWLPAVLKDSP